MANAKYVPEMKKLLRPLFGLRVPVPAFGNYLSLKVISYINKLSFEEIVAISSELRTRGTNEDIVVLFHSLVQCGVRDLPAFDLSLPRRPRRGEPNTPKSAQFSQHQPNFSKSPPPTSILARTRLKDGPQHLCHQARSFGHLLCENCNFLSSFYLLRNVFR